MPERSYSVVTHGGAGASKDKADGCTSAALKAMTALKAGDDALAAAIAAVVHLEDDGRYNAGSGSVFCLDGATVEMDASVMDTRGRLGAVACVQRVKNPILLARAVADTPHWLLVGEGAERFARTLKIPAYSAPSEDARASHRRLLEDLQHGESAESRKFRPFWNYAKPWDEALKKYGHGTVGAVVRDGDGHFAVATSTGGCAPSLLGRVGDSPIAGCGFFAGPLAAIGATGIGEFIVRQTLSRTVYGWLEQGMALQDALDRGIALFDDDVDVGLIAVTKNATAVSSNRDMPTGIMHD